MARTARPTTAIRLILTAACLWLPLACCGCAALWPDRTAQNVIQARELSLKGMEAMQQGEWEQAEQQFASALELCPVDERAHCQIAETLWHRGARKKAMEHMQQAVRLSAANPQLLVRFGEMHLEQNDLARARRWAGRAIEAHPQNPHAWALQGDVLRHSGKRTEALASYHRALNLEAHYPPVQISVAQLYREEGRWQRALATLEHLADQFQPSQVPSEVLMLAGMTLKDLGRYEEAKERLSKAVKRGPESAEQLFQLAETHLQLGDPASARLVVRQALVQDPQHSASLRLAQYIESGQPRVVGLR